MLIMNARRTEKSQRWYRGSLDK